MLLTIFSFLLAFLDLPLTTTDGIECHDRNAQHCLDYLILYQRSPSYTHAAGV